MSKGGAQSLQGLLGRAPVALEQLPVLRATLEGAANTYSEQMRELLDAPVRFSLEGLHSGGAAELVEPHRGQCAISVINAPNWEDAQCLLSADRNAVFAAVEIMLGGDGSQPRYEEKRALSNIEIAVTGLFFAGITKALEGAFAPIARTIFTIESTNAELDFERRNPRELMVAAKFRFDAKGRGGEILLAMPQAALNAHRKALTEEPPKTLPKTDPRWARQIQAEVTRASVSLEAVLEERKGVLGEVSRLKVGQILQLNATPHTRVRMDCNGERLMWCHLGKSNGAYTLRVDELISRNQDFMDDILSA